MSPRIVIATPHSRYDQMIERLRARKVADIRAVTARDELTVAAMAEFSPDYIFFPHWSWKIPAEIYENHPAVIFHMTDLPYGRGGSPLQNLIRRGHAETMLSAIRCVGELDAGPVYLKQPLSLLGTAEEIFLRSAELMEPMIAEIIERRPEPVPQEGEPVVFRRFGKEDGTLERANTLEQAFDFIRMLDAEGYPPALLEVGPYRLEFSRAALKPGAIVADVRITRSDA